MVVGHVVVAPPSVVLDEDCEIVAALLPADKVLASIIRTPLLTRGCLAFLGNPMRLLTSSVTVDVFKLEPAAVAATSLFFSLSHNHLLSMTVIFPSHIPKLLLS